MKPLETQMKNTFLFALILLALPVCSAGQPNNPSTLMARVGEESYRVSYIGVENGLSQGSVYTIFKDSRGFMWFSSQEGLNRYDGVNFRIFRPGDAGGNGLRGSNVVGIVEDGQGKLWIGTEECLNRYDPEKDEFHHVFASEKEGEGIQSICYPFFADDREVWFYSNQEGIIAYDFLAGCRRIVNNRFLYHQNYLTYHSILRTPGGDLWLRSDVGLTRLSAQGGEPEFYFSDHPENLFGKPTSFYSFRYDDKEDFLWLGGEGMIARFDPGRQKADFYRFHPLSMAFDLDQDSQGRVWVGTENAGLLVFDPRNSTFQEVIIQGVPLPLRDLATVFIDAEGVTWVCSDPYGIYKVIPNYRAIRLIRRDHQGAGFRDSYVRTFTEDRQGRIWIGTQRQGITIFDPKTEKLEHIYNEGRRRLLPENTIASLITDGSGRIWIGTENGLACHDPATGEWNNMDRADEYPYRPEKFIRCLLEAGEGKVWFTSEKGLFEADYRTRSVGRLPVFQDTSLTTLFRDRAGNIFVASYFDGFFVVKPDGDSWRRLGYFLPGYYVNCFYLDETGGRLWLGTNKGLWEFAYQREPFRLMPVRQYTVSSGLASSYIYGILPDGAGNLWLSSNRGITRFDYRRGLFYHLGPKDGLQGYEFNTHAYLRSSAGVFYFGGVEGMNFFYPERVGKVPRPTPPVIITDVQLSRQAETMAKTRNGSHGLILDYDNNTFFLSFVAPEYFCDGEIKYRYRLSNYEARWSEPAYENTVRYIRVPPGEYVFQVQAMNCDGQWSKEHTSLAIRIRAPWWWTPWAHLAYVLLFGLLILGAYRFYSWRKLERQEAIHLKRLDEYRNQLYTNITHEFRTPLTAILGMGERIEGTPKVRDLILRNGRKLLDLVNQMLEISRLEAGKDDLRLIQADIQQFIRYVVEPFNPAAAESNQTIELLTDPDLVMMDFDPTKLERILVNLLSNALKFTPSGGIITLETRLDATRRWFSLRVADTGAGIDPVHLPHVFDRFYRGVDPGNSGHAEGTGIGLALVRELTIRLGGQIQVESQKGRGTVFLLKFPVRQDAPRYPAMVAGIYAAGAGLTQTAPPLEAEVVPASAGVSKKPLILVVEDNPDIVTYLVLILQDSYQVEAVADGNQGLEMAVSLIPDLIISDVMMPELDGGLLCQKLKKDGRTSHIPIILLTAKTGMTARISGLETGADVYLEKPFYEKELLVRIDQLLQLRRSLQEHYRRELRASSGDEQAPVVFERRESGFLAKVRALIRQNLSDPGFSVVELAEKMTLSQPQLYRKLKALTGKSPHQLIRDFRLRAAREKMENTSLTVKEVAYHCGFNDPDYFSRLFKEYFGVAATEYRRQNQRHPGQAK